MSSWTFGPKAALVVLLLVVGISAQDVPRPRGTADFVQVLDLESLPNGVSTVTGLCPNRPQPTGSETVPDTAFKIANGPHSVPTRQLFPRGFPNTFAILVTLKPDSDDAGNLFTIYSGLGKALLTFRTSPNIELQYLKANDEMGKITFNDSNVKDGNWHKLAFSVGEDGIALILDCDRPYELKDRPTDFPVRIDTDGLIVLGDFQSSFKGVLQELLVVPDPTKVSQYCKKLMPNCDKPFSKDEMKIMAATFVADTITIGNVRYIPGNPGKPGDDGEDGPPGPPGP